jgi:hypothetical protein
MLNWSQTAGLISSWAAHACATLEAVLTDAADKEAPQRFDANLPIAMANLASLLRLWLE